jgi:hypothetical protein
MRNKPIWAGICETVDVEVPSRRVKLRKQVRAAPPSPPKPPNIIIVSIATGSYKRFVEFPY